MNVTIDATMPMIADAHILSLRHATLLVPTEVRSVATWARHAHVTAVQQARGESTIPELAQLKFATLY